MDNGRVLGRRFAVFASFMILGCAGSDESNGLAIDDIDDAIAAVDSRLGEDSRFYEINATADGVNLFVSTTDADSDPAVVQARYTSSGGLVVSGEAVPSEGPVFEGDDVDFDPATILDNAVEQLSSSTAQVFIITASAPSEDSGANPGIVFRLVMESERGGRLVVFLSRDGSILGSEVLD